MFPSIWVPSGKVERYSCMRPAARRRGIGGSGVSGPSQVVTDTFTDTATTNLSAHTSDSGHTWSYWLASGPSKISTANRLYYTGSGFLKVSYTPPSADYSVQADFVSLTTDSTTTSLFARIVDASNYYRLEWNTANLFLRKIVANVATVIGTFANPVTAGVTQTVKFTLAGTSLKAFIDGVQVISVTDTAFAAAGNMGVGSSGAITDTTGTHVDNFAVFV